MAPRRRPTSHDVARAAGVSRATVSYVLNDVTRQRISPEVRQRVWKAVEQLHYSPDHHARMLKTKESDIVLMVMVGATPGPVLMQAIDNLTRRVAAAGYTPLIDFTGTPVSDGLQSRLRTDPAGSRCRARCVCSRPRIVKALELNGTRCVLAVGDGPGKSIARLAVLGRNRSGRPLPTFLVQRGRKRVLGRHARRPTPGRYRRRTSHRDPRRTRRAAPAYGSRCRWISTMPETRSSLRCGRNPSSTPSFVYNDEYALIVLQVLRDAGIVGAGRHRSDGMRQSALRRADAAVPDDDRYR